MPKRKNAVRVSKPAVSKIALREAMIALRQVAKANGGLDKVAKAAGLKRESLYQAPSEDGNPRLSTLLGIVKAVGLKLTVETV